jgi:predicted RNA binding protein YcfA (HicA-like mRNA interferase family)
MPVVPLVSGRDAVKAFEKLGWSFVRQNGSHMILVKDGYLATLSIPDYKEVARGTLRSLIRDAEITVGEFIKALDR